MPGDGYLRKRQIFGNNSGSVQVATGDSATKTLVTAKTNYTVFLQHATIKVTVASAGKTLTIQDHAGNSVGGAIPCDTAPAEFDMDFGAEGFGLTGGNGSNLELAISGAGAAAIVTWDAYQKLGGVISSAQAG